MQLNDKQVNLALEYARLATRSELSEFEAERMIEILELSQFDDCLGFLVNQIDEFIYQEPNSSGNEIVDYYKTIISKTEEFIEMKPDNILADFSVDIDSPKKGVGVRTAKSIDSKNYSYYYIDLESDFEIRDDVVSDDWGQDTCCDKDNEMIQNNNDLIDGCAGEDFLSVGNGYDSLYSSIGNGYSPYTIGIGSYYADCLRGVPQAEDEYIISNSSRKHSHLCRLTSKQKYLIKEYSELATRSELSDLEAEQMSEILEKAQSDDVLSLLINEVDSLAFQELNFLK